MPGKEEPIIIVNPGSLQTGNHYNSKARGLENRKPLK
jgi:hypothetical protein